MLSIEIHIACTLKQTSLEITPPTQNLRRRRRYQHKSLHLVWLQTLNMMVSVGCLQAHSSSSAHHHFTTLFWKTFGSNFTTYPWNCEGKCFTYQIMNICEFEVKDNKFIWYNDSNHVLKAIKARNNFFLLIFINDSVRLKFPN